jgi:phenylacetate-CoA ligase
MQMFRDLLELRRLLRHQKLSSEELDRLQRIKLQRLIRHAHQNVPYYHSLFKSAGLSPEDIRSTEDLKYLPVTTKEDLKAAGLERIIAKGISPTVCRRMDTSGSTGKPFAVYLTSHEVRNRRSLEFRSLLSIGFHPRDRLSVLGPEHLHHSRFHQRLGFYRSENISVFLPIDMQVRRLENMRPTIFWAYPTLLRALLHHAGDHLSKIFRPRILITSAEPLDEITKERVQAVWGIKGYDFYGAVEVGRIASECPSHEGLHVNADHLILECSDGDRPAAPGKPGTVLVTTLNALAMPFIRYRLGDISTPMAKKCSCGAPFPLIGPVQGRQDDMIQLPSGKLLSSFGLQFILRPFNRIDQFRFIQKSREHLVLQLAIQGSFNEDFFAKIRADFLEYLREPMQVDIQIVNFIQEDRKFNTFINLDKMAHLKDLTHILNLMK